jgi:hypothetical protein
MFQAPATIGSLFATGAQAALSVERTKVGLNPPMKCTSNMTQLIHAYVHERGRGCALPFLRSELQDFTDQTDPKKSWQQS